MNAAFVAAALFAAASLSGASAAAHGTPRIVARIVMDPTSSVAHRRARSFSPQRQLGEADPHHRFSVHELPYRQVFGARTDNNELHSSEAFTFRPSAEPTTPATLRVHVPQWMRSGRAAYPAGVIPATDCDAGLLYRPSGLLDAAAEIRRARFYALMASTACRHRIPVELFDAMIMQESRYSATAASTKNAYGLTQLLPGTALEMGVDRFDIAGNLEGGARYLRRQLDRFGAASLALAAYNAGPARVRGGLIPPIAETIDYVGAVMGNWHRLSSGSYWRDPAGLTPDSSGEQRTAVRSAVVVLF